ncbi:MAG: outer membrane protein assembly factor BamD [Phycisphaerales bacterium]
MFKKIVNLSAILCISVICIGETWRLGSNQQWQKVADTNESSFANIASEAKQYVSNGKTTNAKKSYENLQKQFPEIAGEDYNDYVKAELLYSKRKFPEAAKAYQDFIDKYPDSALRESAIERQFQIGSAFLNGQRRRVLLVFNLHAYEEGTEIMNKIADTTGDAPIAKRAIQTLAQSNEKRGAYEEAYKAWADASTRWPTGEMGKESLLGMARSLEKDYRGSTFDSKVLESSKSYYSQYIERYPDLVEQMGLSNKIEKLDIQMAEKELAVAQYYERTENYNAAHIYYEKIKDQWPQSSAAKISENKLPAMKTLIAESEMPKKKKFNWKELFL